MKEIELRIVDIDLCNTRKILKTLNLPLVKKENQINNIFDFEDGRLLKNKGYARIREVHDLINDEDKYYMTVKKLLSQEMYKIMEESETLIKDGNAGKKIFNALGLKQIDSISKYRESYKYKNTLIEIDINDKSFCPFPYIELEGTSKDEIEEIVTLLGYTMEDTTSDTIYEILKSKNIDKNSNLKGL